MKILISAILAFASFGALADNSMSVSTPLYTCQLSGNISGQSVALIIGGQRLRGPGYIKCVNNIEGTRVEYPVNVTMSGLGVGLEVSRIDSVEIFTAGLGVNDPRFFFKSFSLGATAGLSLFETGIDFDAAFRASRGGAGFDIGLQGKAIEGLGAHLYATYLRITPRN